MDNEHPWFIIIHTWPPRFLMQGPGYPESVKPARFETADDAEVAAEQDQFATKYGYTLMNNETQEFVQ